MDARQISRILPDLFLRFRCFERVLTQVLLEQKYLRGELRRIHETAGNHTSATDECLKALGYPPESLEGSGETGSSSDVPLDHQDAPCEMRFNCPNPQTCPMRRACQGSKATPEQVINLFPIIPTERLE